VIPQVRFGNTELTVTRIALGGFPFGGVNRAKGWDPFSLRFMLSDGRVHVANVGMRWPEEVAKNVATAESFVPRFDMAELPRLTAMVYKTDDQRHGLSP
jgi:aryl-alcohol dehydrogenase-like predicted oxidoreductase